MPKTFSIGSSNFDQVVEQNYFDKTSALSVLTTLPEKTVAVISAPRRFGKSTFLNMTEEFFSYNARKVNTMFSNTAIAKMNEGNFVKEHMRQYPLIRLSLKDVRGSTLKKMRSDLKQVMYDLYRKVLRTNFSEACDKVDKIKIEDSLLYLMELLVQKFNKKVIVLIDEYEANCHEAFINNYYDAYCQYIRKFLEKALSKNNATLQFSVLTGVIPCVHSFLDEKMVLIQSFNMAHPMINAFIGTTLGEFKQTLLQNNIVLKDQELSEIETWYGGYQIGQHTCLNIWSVSIHYCHNLKVKSKPRDHWTQTADISFIKNLFKKHHIELEKDLQSLVSGHSIIKKINFNISIIDLLADKVDAIWSLLFIAGYLTLTKKSALLAAEKKTPLTEYELKIPNLELKYFFNNYLDYYKKPVLRNNTPPPAPMFSIFNKPTIIAEKKEVPQTSFASTLSKKKKTAPLTFYKTKPKIDIRKPLTRLEVREVGLSYLSPRYLPKK